MRDRALRWAVAFAAGALFSLGLALSGMTDPARVLGFLDVTGAWDPALLFVMAGGMAVFGAAWRASQRLGGPLLGGGCFPALPRGVDRTLVGGALLFGTGWGLAGYCPGPALAAAGAGVEGAAVFVAAMVAGMYLHQLATR